MASNGDLTAADVAKMFGVNETTVYKWEREGKLPRRADEGRHTKWRSADIEKVRDRRTTDRTE